MQKLSLILFIGLISISSAHASFDGYYGSLALGWLQGDITAKPTYREQVISTTVTTGQTPYSVGITNAAVLGGIGVGIASSIKQRYLLGFEARANFENLSTSSSLAISSSTIIPSETTVADELITIQVKAKKDVNLLVRLGILLEPNLLLYTVIGPSYGYFEESAAVSNTNSDGFTLGFNSRETGYKLGWVGGIGLDYLMDKNISVALEYTHADYGKLNALQGMARKVIGATTYQAFLDASVYAKANVVSLRASYHFG